MLKTGAVIQRLTVRADPDDPTILLLIVEYRVTTDEGMTVIRTLTRPLTGAEKTAIQSRITAWQTEINTKEGL